MQVCTNLKSFYTSLQSHITLRRKSSKTPQRPLQIVSPPTTPIPPLTN